MSANFAGFLRKLCAHPRTRNLALDDPRTTEIRRTIIREKKFLRQLYDEWYARLLAEIPAPDGGDILEIGSGGGFLKDRAPTIITSECFPCAGCDLVIDAQKLPFADGALRGIVMVDVLHHLPHPKLFFHEVERCLTGGGGTLAMIEPWNTAWAKFIWKNLHHEPFLPDVSDWDLPEPSAAPQPLSLANSALPGIVFARDREVFLREFPTLEIVKIALDYPLSLLFSGGVSMRSFVPGWLFKPFRQGEKIAQKIVPNFALLALIVVRKRT
jgi:SAM-dependent methyltransferase